MKEQEAPERIWIDSDDIKRTLDRGVGKGHNGAAIAAQTCDYIIRRMLPGFDAARALCFSDPSGTCHDNYCVTECRAIQPDARFVIKAAKREIWNQAIVMVRGGIPDSERVRREPLIAAMEAARDET